MSRLFQTIMMLLVVLSAFPAAADVVVNGKGESLTNRFIEKINAEGNGAICFEFRNIGPSGTFDGTSKECDIAQFSRVEFREMMDKGEKPSGRIAHLLLKTPPGSKDPARRYLNATILSAEVTPAGWTFQVRRSNTPSRAKPTAIPGAMIQNIEFSPAPAEMQTTKLDLSGRKYSEKRGEVIKELSEESIKQDATESSPYEPSEDESGYRNPSSSESGSDNYLDDDAGMGNQEIVELTAEQEAEQRMQRAMAGNPTSALEELIAAEQARRNNPNNNVMGAPATNPFSFAAMGGMFILVGMAALMSITFVVGTFVLKYVARSEGITDLTTGRAIAASALMAFVPPTLFVLSFALVPLFIGIKLFAALSAFYLSARMIMMGMLEVNESKATDVMVSFYGVMIFMLCGIWIYFQLAGK